MLYLFDVPRGRRGIMHAIAQASLAGNATVFGLGKTASKRFDTLAKRGTKQTPSPLVLLNQSSGL